jgi:hypothetical protein
MDFVEKQAFRKLDLRRYPSKLDLRRYPSGPLDFDLEKILDF